MTDYNPPKPETKKPAYTLLTLDQAAAYAKPSCPKCHGRGTLGRWAKTPYHKPCTAKGCLLDAIRKEGRIQAFMISEIPPKAALGNPISGTIPEPDPSAARTTQTSAPEEPI